MRKRFALAGVLPMLATAAPALAADPTMPLASVRPGMDCTALSVVRGTAISEFSAEVLDVVQGDSSSTGARILVRLSGPAIDATGVGPGFSGSPVMCPDSAGVRRNAGAISETVGEYGNKVALVTPIEQVLREPPEAPAEARSSSPLAGARPLAGPLTIAGLSAGLRARLATIARRANRSLLAVPAGPLGGFPVQDLRPGAAVTAALSSGDVSVGSIGTVTYRNGSALWAFGHPLDAAGRRALQLSDAYVFTVVNNPNAVEDATTYKLAVPGHVVGTIGSDTLGSIAGRFGRLPRTIPFTADVTDAGTGRSSRLHSRVSDERHLELGSALDLVGTLSLAQALNETLGSSPPRVSTTMCLRVKIAERPRPLGFCDDYQEGFGPFDDLSAALALVDVFKFGTITPTDVSVRARVRRGVREAFILRARAPRRVRPGQRMRVRLLVQHRRGARRRMSFTMRVPRSLRAGRRILTLRGVVPLSIREGSDEGFELVLEDGAGPSDEPGPTSVADLAEQFAAIGRPEGLRATFSRSGRGRVVLRSSRLLLRGKVRVPVRVLKRRR